LAGGNLSRLGESSESLSLTSKLRMLLEFLSILCLL
jgi:hypothetical protein